MKISGRLIDPHSRTIYGAEISVEEGVITAIESCDTAEGTYIMPGFIDAHVHIESSMATPGAFAVEAVRHGTIAVVADPHEIANVLGVEGVGFMIEDARKVPLRFVFGAPSCVPATPFESSGAVVSARDVELLLESREIGFLSEMMNYPGVIGNDQSVMAKIDAARHFGKPVDGHAPGLSGDLLRQYAGAGIVTDHECTTIEEAREKISLGMKILIREGSAAKNLEALHGLIAESPDSVMLCCDDIHPDDLVDGHINLLFRKLLAKGYDLFDLVKVACVNPVLHYKTGTGLLRVGDSADFIIVDDPGSLTVLSVFIAGRLVFSEGKSLFDYCGAERMNRFICSSIKPSEIYTDVRGRSIRIIEAWDGLLNTGALTGETETKPGEVHDTEGDILKIVVKERYTDAPPVAGFVKGFGLKRGAFASSVAHDSHNIIAVGTSDRDIAGAVNRIVKMEGGLSWFCQGEELYLPLATAGIISDKPVKVVAAQYRKLTERVRTAGSKLRAPYMTLSFMALLVIPELKIGDRGLFDVSRFCHVPLVIE